MRLVDRSGDWINGKRTPAVHRLRSFFDPSSERLDLHVEGTSETHSFAIDSERPELLRWLSEYFGITVALMENAEYGWPDDTESPGPTVISVATLREVGGWFGGLSVDEVRQRFRANLEIDGVEPFWEDRLVADDVREVRFRIGAAELLGTNPCACCIVPTRSPTSGEMIHSFAKIFAEHRRQRLPTSGAGIAFRSFLSTGVEYAPGRRPIGDDPGGRPADDRTRNMNWTHRESMKPHFAIAVLIVGAVCQLASGADRTQPFDHDPAWESHNNRASDPGRASCGRILATAARITPAAPRARSAASSVRRPSLPTTPQDSGHDV